MTIEQFGNTLDELTVLYKQLVAKQKEIRCKADGDGILCHESDVLLAFAGRKGIPVSVQRNDEAVDNCRYMYSFHYEGIELIGFSTEIEHQLYKEAGLVL